MCSPARWLRLATLAGAALATLALAPAPAHAARVLFVSDAGADTGIAAALAADGHDVTTVVGDFANGNAALRDDLRGVYDVVFWSASGYGSGDLHADPSVLANLSAFVTAGGRLLVTGYDSVASPFDPLLVELLGASGSTDVPPPPGPVTTLATSLTTGRVDIRGMVPVPTSGDRDTLTGLGPDTIEIVGTSGGGGAQWTLRTLGAGEIAYVSNGDSGASSTASWLVTSADGSGAYNAALRNFAFAADQGRLAAEVEAHGSPRRGRVMWLLDRPSPAVLVGPDRAWLPPGLEAPLALCAGPTCHPVREVRACEPPECPGHGTLVVSSERVADVADFPRGRTEWTRERALLMADPELATLAWAFGTHPEPLPGPPQPLHFLRGRDHWLGWELHVAGGGGALLASGVGAPALSASLGLRFEARMEEGLDVMYGTLLGLDARVTVLPGVSGQGWDDVAVLVGLAPAFSYAFPRERVRIPPAWAWVIPGFGVAVRTDRAPTYYLDWHLEAAALLDEHVGLDARADFVLLDEWVEGDDVEAILSIAVGFFFR